jgi:DNA-binding GntR family transcriptional regulator
MSRPAPTTGSSARLTPVTLAEQCSDLLREQIIWGRLAPGARLVETDLADELGVSRTPVREALKRLEDDGLILRRGGRLTVATFDQGVAVERLLIRELLEPFVAKESAPRLTGPDLARLRSILGEMEAQLDQRQYNVRHSAELNMEFHDLLNSRCPYPLIIKTSRVALDAHSAVRLYSTYTVDDLHRVHDEHAEIVDVASAIASGSTPPEAIATLIREHIVKGRDALLRNITAIESGERDLVQG